MREQEKLNKMLDKAIKRAERPIWKKNLEAIFLLTLYFLVFPATTIYLYYTGNWFFGTIAGFFTFLGLGVSFGGRRFVFWLTSKANILKK